MRTNWTRRDLLKLLVALPAGAWMSRYKALAAPYVGKAKITSVLPKVSTAEIVGDDLGVAEGCILRKVKQ